ncbi:MULTISPECIES: hypothetical protein [unclassified Candidatus Tisiphia]|uniref:hypothetical protein n=1 Tax=unclassified Candidatus Tisiphia TaxID=2996318 RepID=UPI003CCB3CED
MAKSKNEVTTTAKEYQFSGERYYGLAMDMEDRCESQEKIDACWRLAAKDFWQALVLGGKEAPFWLFKCFGQGLGVKEDADIAALFYGVALKFTPKELKGIKTENKPVIPKYMEPEIKNLIKLVEKTHKEIPTKGVDMAVVLEQMDKFNHAIKLPGGKLIQSCFTEENTAATYDEHGASTSAHDTSADSGLHDTSFDEGNVAMGGESSHYPHHH